MWGLSQNNCLIVCVRQFGRNCFSECAPVSPILNILHHNRHVCIHCLKTQLAQKLLRNLYGFGSDVVIQKFITASSKQKVLWEKLLIDWIAFEVHPLAQVLRKY